MPAPLCGVEVLENRHLLGGGHSGIPSQWDWGIVQDYFLDPAALGGSLAYAAFFGWATKDYRHGIAVFTMGAITHSSWSVFGTSVLLFILQKEIEGQAQHLQQAEV